MDEFAIGAIGESRHLVGKKWMDNEHHFDLC